MASAASSGLARGSIAASAADASTTACWITCQRSTRGQLAARLGLHLLERLALRAHQLLEALLELLARALAEGEGERELAVAVAHCVCLLRTR